MPKTLACPMSRQDAPKRLPGNGFKRPSPRHDWRRYSEALSPVVQRYLVAAFD